ncbi:hypothetical protein TNCT_365251 [Trichonephila clavata]|uniref:Secreted protein n=1 Tax=Trichonephila clavata TaxID=2740835 RepID=A0A8X6KJ52_TRICU|nr:hypothetical protein TNCT_365251 [Trichonephila clavata]
MTIPRLKLCACLLLSKLISLGHISSKDADRIRAVAVRFYNRLSLGLIPLQTCSRPSSEIECLRSSSIQRFPVEAYFIRGEPSQCHFS